jgi:hypothetical protein
MKTKSFPADATTNSGVRFGHSAQAERFCSPLRYVVRVRPAPGGCDAWRRGANARAMTAPMAIQGAPRLRLSLVIPARGKNDRRRASTVPAQMETN